jgi:hypothetical protein
MKKIIFTIAVFILFSFQKSFGQWSGSTSNAGTENNPINVNNYQQESKGRFNIGIGIGGSAKAFCKDYQIDYTNVTRIISDPTPTDFNFFMSGLSKTSFDKLWIGFEGGFGVSTKEIAYEYYSNFGIYETIEEVDILHLGAAIPIRYTFVETKEIDLYAQAVLGYGVLVDINNEYDMGKFYGGGAVGARWTILFAELGYNTTGFLRFGLSIPTSK